MKKVAAVLVLVLFGATSAFGGTITFTPQGDTTIFNDSNLGPTSIDYVVGLDGDFGWDSFTAIAQHIGVNGGPTIGSPDDPTDGFVWDNTFRFDPGFIIVFGNVAVDASSEYDSSIQIQAVSTSQPPDPIGRPLPWASIGTLTIDATGAAAGSYDILTRGDVGFPFEAGLPNEAVMGGATFNVVPEPATISLLALGALGLLRRRKTA